MHNKLFCGIALACLSVAIGGATGASAQSYMDRPTTSDFVRTLSGDATAADEGPLRKKDTTRGLRLNVAPVAAPVQAAPVRPVSATASSAAPAPIRTSVAAATQAPAQRAAAQTGGQPSLNFPVRFEFGSAELTAQARGVLDELGNALRSDALQPYRFRLVGHTDAVGSEDYNNDLSRRRAEAAEAYLKERFGIESARIHAVGVGESQPFDTRNPAAAVNRRVEIVREGAAS